MPDTPVLIPGLAGQLLVTPTGGQTPLTLADWMAIVAAQSGPQIPIPMTANFPVLASHFGRFLDWNGTIQCTPIIPTGLGVVWWCIMSQIGAGIIKPTGPGITISGGPNNFTHTRGKGSMIMLCNTAQNVFLIGGDGA